ncbi:hypothetical protein B0H10DRAFT_1949354 [Mycena sp. CBHHK59/15]|nr:hypothetical protein B0H10DRAFT_1949354 [Mycena sp. CBHHK59/15]
MAPRQRVAPKRLVDGSNSEAPSTAHQAIVGRTQARLNAAGAVSRLIKNIEHLDAVLPTTVAEGTDQDEIHRVLTTIHGLDENSADSTFTRRLDILFKEDTQCRDANGRLHLIRRGELGMLMVEKLERIVKEMEFLSTSGVDRSAAEKAAATARKSTSASASKQKDRPSKSKNGAPAISANAAKEASYPDVMAGKNRKSDNTYQPRKGPNLSEEEEDDFVDGEEEESASNCQY